MGTSNATPDHTKLGTVDFTGTTVDIGNTLAEVELSILGGLDTLELDERNVRVLGALGTFETEDAALAVQTVVSTLLIIHPSIHRFCFAVFVYRSVISDGWI